MKKKVLISEKDVEYVAKLANLALAKAEIKKFQKQISSILDYVSTLSEVNTKNIEPFAHATDSQNITREDTPTPGLTSQEALSNSKNTHNNLFKVPAIFGNE